jgi:hypothetical protein
VWFYADDTTESRDRQPVLPKLWRAKVTRSRLVNAGDSSVILA